MPELPEVETIVRALQKTISNATVEGIKLFRPNIRDKIPETLLKTILVDQKINRIFRRSKYILIETNKGYCLFHLGMTGNIILSEHADPQKPHTHAIFALSSNSQNIYLHFIDPRRFGNISAHKGSDWQQHRFFDSIGPEPLELERLGQHLWESSRKRSAPIKSVIMDAKTVVGVGNIYACEALFRSQIHPLLSANKISLKSYEKLAQEICSVLNEAITQGGTSFRDFKNTLGETGYFAVKLNVYGRKGEPCYVCKTPIASDTHAGRSLWYCPKCQKL